ncbi:unnamed protein product [Pleuronectes platessa]|uniref:Uncharacterized protein n=1 Tax=Pleuronectes platessa TaxID=8262 RepID=A0A9N7VKV2_PLEPL|nr:unnamed protein product [Pleuronectes platessa]
MATEEEVGNAVVSGHILLPASRRRNTGLTRNPASPPPGGMDAGLQNLIGALITSDKHRNLVKEQFGDKLDEECRSLMSPDPEPTLSVWCSRSGPCSARRHEFLNSFRRVTEETFKHLKRDIRRSEELCLFLLRLTGDEDRNRGAASDGDECPVLGGGTHTQSAVVPKDSVLPLETPFIIESRVSVVLCGSLSLWFSVSVVLCLCGSLSL